jgi:hypothetical protein
LNISRHVNVALEAPGNRGLSLYTDPPTLGEHTDTVIAVAAHAGFGSIPLHPAPRAILWTVIGTEYARASGSHRETENAAATWCGRITGVISPKNPATLGVLAQAEHAVLSALAAHPGVPIQRVSAHSVAWTHRFRQVEPWIELVLTIHRRIL